MTRTQATKLDAGESCHSVEPVARQRMSDERLFEISAELAGLNTIVTHESERNLSGNGVGWRDQNRAIPLVGIRND